MGRDRLEMTDIREILKEAMARDGVISFARFMELALYCPNFGYYERMEGAPGQKGDFYTSVSVGPLFGELLAAQFADWLKASAESGARSAEFSASSEEHAMGRDRSLQILEAGAHDGRLAADILRWLTAHEPELSKQVEYWILEPSAMRRKTQEATLGKFAGRVRWFGSWREVPAEGVRGVIFANELLDAMPVHRLGWDAAKREWFEWGVTMRGDDLPNLLWSLKPISPAVSSPSPPVGERVGMRGYQPPAVHGEEFVWARMEFAIQGRAGAPLPAANVLDAFGLSGSGVSNADNSTSAPGNFALRTPHSELLKVLPDGFTTEICPAATEWWRAAARALKAGKLMTFDYGLAAEQFFTPERREGTLRAYYRHHQSNDLLARPGEQDLTAQVNFTAISAAGESEGLNTETLTCQGQFLVGVVGKNCCDQPAVKEWTPSRVRQFQTLTHPEHLGRAFRVLVQGRC
jgi:SAM-dependent MidA family methyltransferase